MDLIGAGPSITIIEDAHWADAATLDLLLFVDRRIGGLPAMVVVTYRAEEVGGDHPLRRVLGDLGTVRAVRRLTVPPLSEAAVCALAEPEGRDGARLHAVTGGNPFFVTEALGAPAEHRPATLRDAVMARATRLGLATRAVLDVVSLVPDRAEVAMVTAVVAADIGGLDAGVRSGMLVLDGPMVRFRHELARRAVEADVPAARAVAMHRRILRFLAATDAIDPARLAFHADAAGDHAAVLRYAPLAGRRADALGAHREAAAHYGRALRHAAEAPTAELAELWERRADACERSYWTFAISAGPTELADAVDASARAMDLWRAAGDVEREAVVMARRSHMLWNSGRRAEARETARAAALLLEPLPPGPGLAQAYAALARLSMLARDTASVIALGSTAVGVRPDPALRRRRPPAGGGGGLVHRAGPGRDARLRAGLAGPLAVRAGPVVGGHRRRDGGRRRTPGSRAEPDPRAHRAGPAADPARGSGCAGAAGARLGTGREVR